jgi:L-amino acid N-acyltransferase YncA
MSGRPGAGSAVVIRDAAPADLAIIRTIYSHHVLHGLASFEEVPPDAGEIERRYRDIVDRGLPYVVVEADGRVAGFAYAGPYRTRPAYRYTVEDSVYVAPDAAGRGLGRAALAEVIHRAAGRGCRQMIAIIGDSGNHASIRLHEKLGFRHAAVLQAVGFKFGRWVDTVLMQLRLGPGAGSLPDR